MTPYIYLTLATVFVGGVVWLCLFTYGAGKRKGEAVQRKADNAQTASAVNAAINAELPHDDSVWDTGDTRPIVESCVRDED
jgi:hypothetical protein